MGKLHRDNDLPAIEWADVEKEWWINGVFKKDNQVFLNYQKKIELKRG